MGHVAAQAGGGHGGEVGGAGVAGRGLAGWVGGLGGRGRGHVKGGLTPRCRR